MGKQERIKEDEKPI